MRPTKPMMPETATAAAAASVAAARMTGTASRVRTPRLCAVSWPSSSAFSVRASKQSAPIARSAQLEQIYVVVAQGAGEDPARPDNWGGYRLIPDRIEFWQGRRSRFHDRIVYERQEDGGWTRQRLQP